MQTNNPNMLYFFLAKLHCLYNGDEIAVGKKLVIECAESCTCVSTGQFVCAPVCADNGQGQTDLPPCIGDVNDTCCDPHAQCLYGNK